MTAKVVMYLVYLAVSIGLTVWVGATLSRNGKVFLEDAFNDERLAVSVNHLLVVGFYLLNLGYVSVAMRDSGRVGDSAGVLEELSVKVGLVLLVLGVVHFFNLFALSRYRRNRLRAVSGVPPLAPVGVIAPQPMRAPQLQAAAQNAHAAQAAHVQAAQAAQAAARAAQAREAGDTSDWSRSNMAPPR